MAGIKDRVVAITGASSGIGKATAVLLVQPSRRFSTMLPLFMLFASAGLLAQEPQYTFGTTVVSTSGLQGRIYFLKHNANKLPRFDKMKSAGTIYTNTLNVAPRRFEDGFPGITDRFEWFAIDYTGRFWVEEPGEYRFNLLSDDGSRLSIDGQELIDNDGVHAALALSASAFLSRGIHALRVTYFQGPRFEVALVLRVGAPGADWRIFNTDDFLPPKDAAEWVTGQISEVRHSRRGVN